MSTDQSAQPPFVPPSVSRFSLTPADPFANPSSPLSPSLRSRLRPNTGDTASSSSSVISGLGSRPSTVASNPPPSNTSALSRSVLVHNSQPNTSLSISAAAARLSVLPRPKVPRMRSHMIPESSLFEKPWLATPNPRARIAYYLVYILVSLGAIGGAVKCYFDYQNVLLDRQPLCLVFDEGFDDNDASRVFGSPGSKGGTFIREVNMDGSGNGQFEMTTSSQNNSFISDGLLHLVPTLTSDQFGASAVFGDEPTIYNATDCTFKLTAPNGGYITDVHGQQVFDWDSYYRSCSAVSNTTSGTIINPVQSARISTRFSASIKYGKVEIKAKMPSGDWMWPAIWMLPVDSVYGPWPLSGEIDLVESRGNGIRYTARGSNYVQGSLNWGPSLHLNGIDKTYSWWSQRRRSFSQDFHTYVLEWTDKFLRIYVDTRLHTLLDLRLNKPFFQRGEFPEVVYNASGPAALQNPWINGTNATPFDQDFYLILNVAVGSTTGWFPDGQGNKPWINSAPHAMRDFAKGLAQWYPTWPSNAEDRGMVVDYVKMWKHC